MQEEEVKMSFENTIESYPFAVHIEREVSVGHSRVDLRLPDYDVSIEAKGSNGNLKKAVGQALFYREYLDDKPYILVPTDQLELGFLNVCKDNDIGVIVSRHWSKVVVDIGGFEAFDFSNWDGTPKLYDNDTPVARETVVV